MQTTETRTQNRVPVIDADHQPLTPCTPRRARIIVKQGKAQGKHRNGIYHLVLNRTIPSHLIQKASITVNPGSATTGIAVVRDGQDQSRSVLFGIELHHRGQFINRKMVKRSQNRRTRRGRLRYRKPRFSNRRRQPGWMPPSLKSRLLNTLTWIDRLSGLIAVNDIHMETQQFDTQRLADPAIQGEEYQQGPLYQTTLRAYVIHREDHRCIYCNRKPGRFTLDHVIPRNANGPTTPGNIVATCERCNRAKGNRPVEDYLGRRPKVLERVKTHLKSPMAAAAHLNAIIPRLLADLRDTGWTVTEHDAAQTAANRRVLDIPKSHFTDAAVLGPITSIRNMPGLILGVTAAGRGLRQRAVVDRNGTPRGSPYREYCRLTPQEQAQTPTPGHKGRAKRVQGIGPNDLVEIQHRTGTHCGTAGIYRDRVTLLETTPALTAKLAKTRLIARHHGYLITLAKTAI